VSALVSLVAQATGEARAERLVGGLDLEPSLLSAPSVWVGRDVLAQALAIVLLDHLLDRVPTAAAYVEEKLARGEKVRLDHGAVRTVAGVTCGALPPGQESVTRVLSALGYQHRGTYDLDLPSAIPQYFVSELHAERFSPDFVAVAARVLGSSRDPLHPVAAAQLEELGQLGGLAAEHAAALLPVLVACFGRHHHDPALSDYHRLLAESEEMAWIATEGTAFNHATDRVADVYAVAEAERAAGRPVKDTVEVSASGRIRQTAHRAALVRRRFGVDGGDTVELDVPGSFFEFITRDPSPDGSGPDLAFDAANAQHIFAMTRGGHDPAG